VYDPQWSGVRNCLPDISFLLVFTFFDGKTKDVKNRNSFNFLKSSFQGSRFLLFLQMRMEGTVLSLAKVRVVSCLGGSLFRRMASSLVDFSSGVVSVFSGLLVSVDFATLGRRGGSGQVFVPTQRV